MLLTIADIAARLNVSTKHVRRIIARGEIHVIATGTSTRGDRIDEADFQDYLKKARISRAKEQQCPYGKTTINIVSRSCASDGALADRLTQLSKQKNSKRKPSLTSTPGE